MTNNMDCTKKAKGLWMDICCMYFDYDSSYWVTNKAYNIHLEIEHILRTGKCWDGGWDA